MLMTPFDSEGVSIKTSEKYFDNPESEYYHMTAEQIREAWSAKGATSTHYGSLLDDYIGAILTGTENDLRLFKLDNGYDYDERLHGLCDSFDNFYSVLSKSGDTEFIDREKYLYLKVKNPFRNEEGQDEYMYMYGRFDALFRNKRTGKYILIDWKSSGTVDKVADKWTKKMLGPMFKYPQLNWYQYTLQLYFYKQALLNSGYLPEGTSPDDIVVMIVNLPGKIIEGCGQNYQIHQGAIPYNETELNNFYEFAIKKYILLEAEKKEKEEHKEEVKQETNNDNNNLEDLF
jgi:hypothetical protein